MLVANVFHNAVFHGMRERAVANIVQQDGHIERFRFFFGNLDPLGLKHLNGFLHQKHGAQRMVKAGMVRTRVHDIGKAHLRNAAEPLEIFVPHQIKNQLAGYGNKTVDRVVYSFVLRKVFQTLTLN